MTLSLGIWSVNIKPFQWFLIVFVMVAQLHANISPNHISRLAADVHPDDRKLPIRHRSASGGTAGKFNVRQHKHSALPTTSNITRVRPAACQPMGLFSRASTARQGCSCISSASLVVRCSGPETATSLLTINYLRHGSGSRGFIDELQLTDEAAIDAILRQPECLKGVPVYSVSVTCTLIAEAKLDTRLLLEALSPTGLTQLSITRCRLDDIVQELTIFDGLRTLRVLRLWFNRLEFPTFATTTVGQADYTKLLHFPPSASVTSFPPDRDSVMSHPSELRELQLWGNGISHLADGAFTQLGHLNALDLDRNQITSIRRSSWIGLSSLQSLHLSHNQLSTLPDRAFFELRHLRSLSLNSNLLGLLHPAAFFGLANLLVLRLADNRIPFIGDGAFNDLTSLRRLDLSGNRLDRVWSGTFSGFRSLEWIDLSRNRLVRIPDGTFAQSTGLNRIKLDWNRLGTGLSRCALAADGRSIRSVSLLGNRIPCGSECRTFWLTGSRASHVGHWNTAVLGSCIINGTTEGSINIGAIHNPTSYQMHRCNAQTHDC